MNKPTDLKACIVYWGLTFLFLLKFGKFLVVEAWDTLAPLLAKVP